MKSTNNIFLVRVPAQEIVDGRELRDYILESLSRGVLVLTEDASCEVMELPKLGEVEIEPTTEQADQATKQADSTADSGSPEPLSEEAAEKRAVLQRMIDYRKENGLGCLEKVSEKTAHFKADRLSAETLRLIITGDAPKMDISEWRKIAKALDVLEAPVPC